MLQQLVHSGDASLEVGSGIGAHAIALAARWSVIRFLFVYEDDPLLAQISGEQPGGNRSAWRVTQMRRALGGCSRLGDESWAEVDRRRSRIVKRSTISGSSGWTCSSCKPAATSPRCWRDRTLPVAIAPGRCSSRPTRPDDRGDGRAHRGLRLSMLVDRVANVSPESIFPVDHRPHGTEVAPVLVGIPEEPEVPAMLDRHIDVRTVVA